MSTSYRVVVSVPCDSLEFAQGLKICLDSAMEEAFQDGEMDQEIEATIEPFEKL